MEIDCKVEIGGGDIRWRWSVEMVGGDSVCEGKWKSIVIVITLLASECT